MLRVKNGAGVTRVGVVAVCLLTATVALRGGQAVEGDAAGFWPEWRGPLHSGVAPAGDPPVTWGESSNVRWKVALPGLGSATPVIWGDRLFVLTAAPTGERAGSGPGFFSRLADRFMRRTSATDVLQFVVLAIDRRDGGVLWERVAREAAPHQGRHGTNTWASPSAVTDGEVVCASFGSVGLYCYDLDGRLLLGRRPRRHADEAGLRRGRVADPPRRPPDRPLGPPGPVVHRRVRQADGPRALADAPRRGDLVEHSARDRGRGRGPGGDERDRGRPRLRRGHRRTAVVGPGGDRERHPHAGVGGRAGLRHQRLPRQPARGHRPLGGGGRHPRVRRGGVVGGPGHPLRALAAPARRPALRSQEQLGGPHRLRRGHRRAPLRARAAAGHPQRLRLAGRRGGGGCT